MARHSTFPILYDKCKTIDISFLKANGYLDPYSFKQGNIQWSRNGQITSSINILVDMEIDQPYLELTYIYQSKININYKVNLVSIASNLEKGKVWYFICPQTNQRCRKLYLIAGYFFHRSAFKGCMYEKQTESHKFRFVTKQFSKIHRSDKADNLLHSKHFKQSYKGKPTKRYLQAIQDIEKAKSVRIEDFFLY